MTIKTLFKLLTASLVLVLFSSQEGMAQNCVAQFQYQVSGSTVTFTNTSTGGNTYNWTFGTSSTSSAINPVVTYNSPGSYLVCLSVSDSISGCFDSYCDTVVVSSGSSGCTANFTYSVSGNTLSVTNTSSGGNSYTWSFGDGNASNAFSPSYTYASSSNYTVCLTVFDTTNNCSDTYCTVIPVGIQTGPCSALFTYINSGNAVLFSNSSSFSNSYSWSFGDGSTSNSFNPVHTYSSAGVYSVCLTVTDTTNGCTDTYCDSVSVIGSTNPCNASFTYTMSAPTVTFTNTSNVTGTYVWVFGDGNTSTAASPVHTYSVPGTYNVCMVVTTQNCSDSTCQTIVIPTQGNCQAAFSYSLSGSIATFTNQSTGGTAFAYSWDFGDGNTSTAASPVHTYNSVGSHNVCLTITDTSNQCVSQSCQTIFLGTSSIYGSVNAGPNYDVDATVYLITLDLWTGNLTAIDTIDLDPADTGAFTFNNLASGTYMVKAALNPSDPDYNNYLPTYNTSSLFWQGATNLTVGPSAYAGISLVAGNNPGGPGFIGGSIFQGANKKEGEGDPIVGAVVLLLDQNGDPVAYDISDSDGNVGFPNLAYGTYQVHAEILDKTTNPAWVTIDANNPSNGQVDIIVNESGVTTSVRQPEQGVAGISTLFPNPAQNLASMTINAVTPTRVNVRMVNLLGQPVMNTQHQLSSGVNQLEWNVADLAPGLYLVEVASEDGKFLQTIELVKR